MSTRPIIRPYPVINSGDMSDDITSEVTIVQEVSHPSFQAVWTGTSPVGTLELQGSNDYRRNPAGGVENPGTWTTIYFSVNGATPSATMPVTGNTGSGLIDVETSIYALRVVYTSTSGTGTLNVTVAGKAA